MGRATAAVAAVAAAAATTTGRETKRVVVVAYWAMLAWIGPSSVNPPVLAACSST